MNEATGRRVLVADDEADIRDILALNLEADGVDVQLADNGEDAVALADELLPDLIVLDIMMPRLDGIGALSALRANPRTCAIPVVLLTAKATDDEIMRGWQAGADYYITKPFNIDELLHFIEYLFSSRAADEAAAELT
jgi:DNA-binding response OmpR family regulator